MLAACVVLLFLCGPEAIENAQIVSGANSRDQAKLIYRALSQMVALSPALRKIVRCTDHTGVARCGNTGAHYTPLAADGAHAMGLSPILVILDEIGQIPEPESAFVDSLTTSQLAYGASALLLAISTQAPLDSSLFSLWIDDAVGSEDPTLVCHLYAAPPDCEVDDEGALIAANPGLGYFLDMEVLKKEAAAAKRGTNANAFRNLHLNQRVDQTDSWMSEDVWRETFGDLLDWHECSYVTAGLDLSESQDLTAFTVAGVRPVGNWLLPGASRGGEWQLQSHCWKPADTLQAHSLRDKRDYSGWAADGILNTTRGKTIDFVDVAKDVVRLIKASNVKKVYYDPAMSSRFLAEYKIAGGDLDIMEPLKQSIVQLTEPTKALRDKLISGQCWHSKEDKPLTMAALNAKDYTDINMNSRLTKKRSIGRIDPIAAAVNAVHGLVNFTEPADLNIY
ncbi:terminase TerL endonuclease subunit [Burkholderia sp. PAMC 28687]|uniref:terminase TerL endonuclease subunit n=1 Tax=Burkholderia sp. PAMC 28687 TaxID=1795874 RepID=UPI0012D84026|nr:terminase TerL endonuclease subunit [Burkholderia sp. PAMC 28687]